MTTVEVLRKARALIEDPEKWTQGHDARDADGNWAGIHSLQAHSFCATGALMRAGGDVRSDAYEALREQMGVNFLMEFNDSAETSHADVLAAFDRAIEVSS